MFKAEGLRIITTLPQTPRMNAICERVNGTLRRELLDRILIIGERHLTLVLGEHTIDILQSLDYSNEDARALATNS